MALALVVCSIAFGKELLWRVRNRLYVTYFLFGVVPIFLIGLLLMLTAELLLGQFATQRVRQDLAARIDSVRSTAQNLVLAASRGAKPDVLDGARFRGAEASRRSPDSGRCPSVARRRPVPGRAGLDRSWLL